MNTTKLGVHIPKPAPYPASIVSVPTTYANDIVIENRPFQAIDALQGLEIKARLNATLAHRTDLHQIEPDILEKSITKTCRELLGIAIRDCSLTINKEALIFQLEINPDQIQRNIGLHWAIVKSASISIPFQTTTEPFTWISYDGHIVKMVANIYYQGHNISEEIKLGLIDDFRRKHRSMNLRDYLLIYPDFQSSHRIDPRSFDLGSESADSDPDQSIILCMDCTVEPNYLHSELIHCRIPGSYNRVQCGANIIWTFLTKPFRLLRSSLRSWICSLVDMAVRA